MNDSFGARTTLQVGSTSHRVASLRVLTEAGHDLARLPYSIRVLLETRAAPGLHRRAGGGRPGRHARVRWHAMGRRSRARINPLQPVDLVIDHSVQVDSFGSPSARAAQRRARVRAQPRALRSFLRWGQQAFRNFKVVPPDTGHRAPGQPRVPRARRVDRRTADGDIAYPDTLVGTDSHTTMINGAGRARLGRRRHRGGGGHARPARSRCSMPQVVGFELIGALPEGATATDLVLTVTRCCASTACRRQVRRVLRPGMRGH